jgi:magnesium-transporting ATPase (P-type)
MTLTKPVITVMVVLSVTLAFVQEHRSNGAAARLRAMVRTTATVLRRGADAGAESHCLEIPIEELVPGDVVRLAAGDMIPADLRVFTAKDLFLNEAVLTGEAMPVEKSAAPFESRNGASTDSPNICFMGSNVLSGASKAKTATRGLARRCGCGACSITAGKPPRGSRGGSLSSEAGSTLCVFCCSDIEMPSSAQRCRVSSRS